MMLVEAFRQWIFYRQRMTELNLVAPSTFGNQASIVNGLARNMPDKQLEELRKSDIELWMGERLQTCSPVTIRGEMNVLRQILNWCVDEGYLATKPRLPKLSVPNVEAALPSDEAFQWVLKQNRPEVSIALEFMMLTGLSPHELERLEKRDVDLKPGAVIPCDRNFVASGPLPYVMQIGMRDDFPVKQESRRRKIPLNARASTIWDWVIVGTPDSRPFPKAGALQKAMWRTAVAELAVGGHVPEGADKITPKMMRKWFASKAAGNNPEHVLQRLMGHAPGSPITRRHYVRSNEHDLQAAVNKFPQI